MSRWFLEGDPVQCIEPDDRAVQYGDGLFETVAIRDARPRLWDYHVERLQTGCGRVGIPAPDADVLEEQVLHAIGTSSADAATAKLVVSAGPGPRGYRRTQASNSVLLGISGARELPPETYRDGVTVRLCNTRLAIQPQLAGMKTLNRLEQVLARNEWDDAAVFEGLTLDTDGRVICGTMSNVFLVYDNRLVTPALTRCGVSGVMWRHVLTVARESGVSCDVRDVGREELDDCDGLVLSNSQFGVVPVTSCGRRTLEATPAIRSLMGLIRESGIREVAV